MYRLPIALGALAALSAAALPAQHLPFHVSATHLQRSHDVTRAAAGRAAVVGGGGGGGASANPHVVYNWTTRSLQRTRRLRSGGKIGVRMDGMNPLCYEYVLEVQEVAGSDAALDVAKLLAGGYTPAQATTQTGTGEGAAASERVDLVLPAAAAFAAAPPAVQKLRSDLVTPFTTVAQKLLDWQEFVAGFDNRICSSPVAAQLPQSVVLARWTVEGASRLADIRSTITTLRGHKITALNQNQNALAAQIEDVVRVLSEIEADGLRTSARLTTPESLVHERVLQDDTERAVVTMVARPYAEYTALTSQTETHAVPVRRYHRQFLSLGFVHTDAEAADFERRRVISGDTTVSTYVDVGQGSSWVVSPVVSVNYTLFDVPVFEAFRPTLMLTGGVTSNGTDAQFLLGTGIGLSDRVVLSAYAHFFPSEELLLGDAAVIRGRAVPDDISDEDAVRTKFNTGFAFGLSYRL